MFYCGGVCDSREAYLKYLLSTQKNALEMEDKIKALRALEILFGNWSKSRLTVLSYVVSS